MEPTIIAISSIIGGGKTTALEFLKENLPSHDGKPIVYVKEPVDDWKKSGVLEAFYQDMKRYAYEFQSYVFVSRIKALQTAIEQYGPDHIFITERSIYDDRYMFVEMLHDSGMIDDRQYQMYIEWWELWSKLSPYQKPHAFVLLNPSIDICMQRLQSRGRNEDMNVPKDYQLKLLEKHHQFFNEGAQKYIYINDTDYRSDEKEAERFLTFMKSVIKNCEY